MTQTFSPSFHYEDQVTGFVAGVDEAGCGPWAGPVTAGAAIIIREQFPEELLTLLNDSKKLTLKKREHIFEQLTAGDGQICHIGFGQASVEEIDRLNIRASALLAMQRAIQSLKIKPSYALVDGTGKPKLECDALSIIKGDSKSYSIAAASIIAKVARDKIMRGLSIEFPQYLWDKNAGYGTKDHQNALKLYGVTPHHRKTYKPIASLLAA